MLGLGLTLTLTTLTLTLTLALTLNLTLTLALTLSSFPVLRSNMPMTQTLAAIKDLTPKMQAPARDTRARRRGILGWG